VFRQETPARKSAISIGSERIVIPYCYSVDVCSRQFGARLFHVNCLKESLCSRVLLQHQNAGTLKQKSMIVRGRCAYCQDTGQVTACQLDRPRASRPADQLAGRTAGWTASPPVRSSTGQPARRTASQPADRLANPPVLAGKSAGQLAGRPSGQ
jgi:hypothetical protein